MTLLSKELKKRKRTRKKTGYKNEGKGGKNRALRIKNLFVKDNISR